MMTAAGAANLNMLLPRGGPSPDDCGTMPWRLPVMKTLERFLIGIFLIYDQPQAQSKEETGDYDSKEDGRHPHSFDPITAKHSGLVRQDASRPVRATAQRTRRSRPPGPPTPHSG